MAMSSIKKVSSEQVIWTSFAVDVIDIVTNVVVAVLSGSAVILATALRGTADLLTTIFLLLGLKLSHRRADKGHQFGYGRELYFWAFLSSLALLTITGGLSLYYGLQHYNEPRALSDLTLSIIVLVIGIGTNGYAFWTDIAKLKQSNASDSLLVAFLHTNLVEIKIALVLDFMGVLTATLGVVSLALYQLTGEARLDGLGAILISGTVVFLASYLVIEVKDLIIGRSALPEVEIDIKTAAHKVRGVRAVLDLRTLYIGPENLLVNMEVAMDPKLTTNTLEQLMDKIKETVKHDVPAVKFIQIELETSSKIK
jgi:cation diffusion facilitator family transporter